MDDEAEILDALRDAGLIAPGEVPPMQPITGGVSSAVLRIDLPSGPVCAKRALAQLKVSAEWKASVERALSESRGSALLRRWMRWCQKLFWPRRPPSFVMEFLDPDTHPCWKPLLAENKADTAFAAAVGDALGRIHAHTANSSAYEHEFAHGDLFHDLRVDPYLLHTARAHPDRAAVLQAIADQLGKTRIALMHGDVSPKNILKGPKGPIFLDAECASYGDPAFDLAFCLNHLLLKSVWHREFAHSYAASFRMLHSAYLAHVDWEDRAALDGRAARLLAGLLLARIDGKSPVEYLQSQREKGFVRAAARDFLARTDLDVPGLHTSWCERIETF